MSAPLISLRPIEPGDEDFLRELYGSAREEELAVVPWSPAEKQKFLDWQFQAQSSHYREHYPDASFQVILLDGALAGRLYVARSAGDIRVIDIALMPAYRGRNVGTTLLKGLMDEAGHCGKSVSLHVECFNPAQRLYARLGFQKAGETGVYWLLEWRPPAS